MEKNETLLKIILTCLAIILIYLVIYSSTILLDFLSNVKAISSNDFFSFSGGVIGALIAGAITLIALYLTIKNANKKNSEALRQQLAIEVDNSHTMKINSYKKITSETIADMVNLINMLKKFRTFNQNYYLERKNILALFQNYNRNMLLLRLSTDIFHDYSMCENCSRCVIQAQPMLANRATQLQQKFREVEITLEKAFFTIDEALLLSMDATEILSKRTNTQELKTSAEKLADMLTQNPNLSSDKTVQDYQNDIIRLSKELEGLDAQINKLTDDISSRYKLGNSYLEKLVTEQHEPLLTAIYRYYSARDYFLSENYNYALKHGTKSKLCNKFNFYEDK